MQSLRVRLLGQLQVEGCDPGLLGRRQLRTLLKVLALRHDRPVSTDTLIECIWGDQAPDGAADQISVLVSRLRRVTGADRVRRTDGGYELSVDWLDVDELASRADEAEHRLTQGAVVASRAAASAGLSLLRGTLLADELDPWWAAPERAHTDLLASRLRRTALEAAQAAGDWRDVERQALELMAVDPYDEASMCALMESLARTGRSASALARYAEMRARLAEDLGIDPSAPMEQLHTAILRDEVTAAAPASAPSGAGLTPPGRAVPFAQLNELIAEVEQHGCRVAVLEGQPGMGKSHLLRSWASFLESRPCLVIGVACDELGQGLPLQPLFDVVNELNRSTRDDGGLIGGADDAVLKPFLDIEWQPTDAAQLALLTDPGAGQALLFGALRNVLRGRAETQTLVLIIDDLHLADPATVRWLSQAPRHLADVPLLLVGAVRPEEASPLPGATSIVLEPLDDESAVAIVGTDRAADLLARSGGNPLFLVELAAADPGEELPESIRHAVEERCRKAGPAAPTLRAAAVVGPEFDLDLLNAVTGLTITELLDHLEEGVRRHFLLEVGPAFAFSHALVREALASSVGAARSAFIHRQSARALSARPVTDPMAVARHARLGGELPEASAMLVTAAQMAVARFDRDEALRLVNEAIGVHASVGAHLERARLLSVLSRYEEAAHDIDTARAMGGGAEVLEVSAWSAHFERRFADAIALADEGVATATSEEVRTSCQSLGGWVALVSGDTHGAERRLEDALGTAPAGSGSLANSWMAWLRVNQGRAADALALVHPAEGQGLEAYRFPNAYALMAASMAYATLGQPDQALRTIAALTADATRMGAQRWIPRPLNLKSWIARNLGEVQEADELNQAAMAASEGPGMAEPLANALLDLAAGRLMDNDLDAANDYLRRADDLGGTEHAFRWRHQLRARLLRARCELSSGDAAAASAGAAALGEAARTIGVPRYGVQAGIVEAIADQRSGVPVDRGTVNQLLHQLEDVAGLEAWWITREVAQAFAEPRWDALARARVGALVERAGPYAASLERVARRVLG